MTKKKQVFCRKYAAGNNKNKNGLLWKIATWNVRGINQIGKLAIIEAQVEKISILRM